MEVIKSNVIKSKMAVPPEVLQELVPLIIEKSEAWINENITKGLETCRRNLPDNLNVNKEVNSFIRRNNDHWQKKLEKRKDVYYKFTRSDQLILLYNECLEEEPIYIPRKFRNDNTFTMNEQEKNIYFKLDLTKLKTEMEILTTRREYFRKKLDEIDQEFTAFIESESVSEIVKKKLEEEWVKLTTESNAKIDAVWQKIIKGKKEAFQRDKVQKIVILVAITLIIV